VDFIQNSSIVTAMVGLLQAPPGTRLYERLRQEGRLLERMSGDNADGTTNIIPIMNRDTLFDAYQNILKHIYAPDVYYKRVRAFLREYSLSKIRIPMDVRYFANQMMALFRSFFWLGVVGKERLQYWRLLSWTIFRRPTAFPLAITLAIYGHHFRKISDLMRIAT
jgi:hypothetical protein